MAMIRIYAVGIQGLRAMLDRKSEII